MITQDNLNNIYNFLNLEKITVTQRIEILCFPKKHDVEFLKKFDEVKSDLKKTNQNIDLKIVAEGFIDNGKYIEFSGTSGSDGID